MNRKTVVFFTIILGVFFTVANNAWANTDAARHRLNNFFTKVNTVEASFSQQVFSKKGKLIQTSTGNLYLNRPGKFRWEYKTPDPQIIVSDGRNIWIYEEDLDQVTIKPMSTSLSSTPISLLTQKQSPDIKFFVKSMKTKAGGLDWFQLTPRQTSNDFKLVEIGLDSKGLRQMNMLDQLGQKTVVRLSLKANVPMKSNLFTFKVPEGVDVIGKAL